MGAYKRDVMNLCTYIHGVYSKEVGVNCRSELLRLEHFDLRSGALVPDVMFDLLEGLLLHLLCLLLPYCVEEKRFFNLSYLKDKKKYWAWLTALNVMCMYTSQPLRVGHWGVFFHS